MLHGSNGRWCTKTHEQVDSKGGEFFKNIRGPQLADEWASQVGETHTGTARATLGRRLIAANSLGKGASATCVGVQWSTPLMGGAMGGVHV